MRNGWRGAGAPGRLGQVTGVAALVTVLGLLAGCTQTSNTQAGPTGSTGPTSATGTTRSPSTHPTTRSTTPSQPPARVHIAAPEEGSPANPITVTATSGALKSVDVAIPGGGSLQGTFGSGHRAWSSTGQLDFGSSYAVTATAANAAGAVSTTKGSVSTVTPGTLVFPQLTPAAGLSDIGVGQPLRVDFVQSPDDTQAIAPTDRAAIQRKLAVTVNPPQPGAWYWISSNIVDYRPKAYWQPGTTIKLTAGIYGASFGHGAFGKLTRTATYTVHATMIAVADGHAENMKIYDSADLTNPIKTMNISLGSTANGTPTHSGIHVVVTVEKHNPYIMNSCTYGLCPPDPGAYIAKEYNAVRISDDGEFVHTNLNSIGSQGSSNVSHGCVNLNQADGQWFYTHFKPGDVVIVNNSGGPKLPLGDLWGDWSLPWSVWSAGNATG